MSLPERPSAEAIARWIVSALATRLGIDPGGIDRRERFTRYGLDSAGAMELTVRLGERLGRRLPPTLLWEYPTVGSVAAQLAGAAAAPTETPAEAAASVRSDEPIAIVGMGCRFPRAASPEAFWRLLRDGVDAISEVPADRWDIDAYFDPDLHAPGKMTTRWGGFLERIDGFDAAFFGISPREAVEMDPQQRLMLEVAWEALEDAGLPHADLKGSRTGVFFGAIWSDYATLRQRGDAGHIKIHTATGAHHSIIANRVSYLLGLQGPSMTVDTACSSSLVAVHLACQSLRAGESTVALAGGVTLIAAPESTIAMSKLGTMAPDGRVRAFDAAASGYVRGEGAGVIVLKRLSDALAAGDRIHAVVRGSAVNNDGFSNGLTAPNPDAQVAVLREACRNAGVAPHEVQVVEAHGTGTALGDPIEAKALGAVLGAGRPADRPLRIGSVKSNIGHLEAAAGMAGLMKVVLAMRHGELPPSLHFERPNPHIPFEQLGLHVPRALEPWRAEERPRLAGVSSFGFGGTNAHVVVEELAREQAQVLPLAASSPAALHALVREAEEALAARAASLEAIARSAAAHASRGAHRLAIIASSVDEARRAVAQHLAGGTDPALVRGAGGGAAGVVFVCSGQGSQWPGMGRETLAREPVFRAKLEACDVLVRRVAGWSVLEQLTGESSRSRLREVDVVQPLIFALQVAQAELWRSWGIAPAAVIGHSMGEVSAAHIAGILDLEDAVSVICTRSRLVRERAAGTGAMAVVDLSVEELPAAGVTLDGISVAALNGPRTTVVGGDAASIHRLVAELQQRGLGGQLVDVDYASHTAHMEPLLAELVTKLAGLRPRPPAVPMVSTVVAPLDERALDAAYWAENLRRPVQLWPRVADLVRRGHDTFVELGGHPLLARPIMAALAEQGISGQVVASFRKGAEVRTLLEGVATLHARGAAVRWPALHAPPAQRTFHGPASTSDAPGEPAPEQLFTLSARDADALRAQVQNTAALLGGSEAAVADLCYTANLRRGHHDARVAVRCRTVDDLRTGLGAFLASAADAGKPFRAERPRLAFVFQGQGGQWWKMGRELLRDEPVFRRAIDACDAALRPWTSWSLLEELTRDEASSRIDDIEIAQPAIWGLQVALAALWRSWGIVPDAVVGHSMGEVAAAHVAGALSLADAARVIRHRSRLMRRVAGQGAMAVVELSRPEAERAIAGETAAVSVAGSNSPRACVLSGEPAALQRVLDRVGAQGVFHRLLRVDVASHSPQMGPLGDELVASLDGLAPRAGEVAFFSSVTAGARAGDTLDPAYWGRNLRDPFLFADTIARVAEGGTTLFVEIGPHPILGGAIGDVQRTIGKELRALPSLRRNEEERGVMLGSLAELYGRGFSPAWSSLHPRGGRVVELPTYPWREERFWPSPEELKPAARPAGPASWQPRRLDLAGPAAAAEAGHEVWEVALGVEAQPWLADHVVQGETTLPAAAQLALVLAAARDALGEGVVLTDVALEKAVFLPAATTRTLQVLLEPAAAGRRFQLWSQETGGGEGAWMRHARGAVTVERAAGRAAADLAAIRSRLAPHPVATHQAALEQAGLRYGPSFRGLVELWRREGEVVALLAKPAALGRDASGDAFHPAFLDAALQAVYAVLPPERLGGGAGEPFIPVAVRSFRVEAPLPEQIWCHARVREPVGPDDDAFEAELTLHDATGRTLIEVSGLRFQRLGGDVAAAAARDPARWQYELRWQPAAPLPAASSPGRWIVLGDRRDVGRDLAAEIEAAGGSCVRVEHGGGDELRRQLARGDVRGVVHLQAADLPCDRVAVQGAVVERACVELVEVVKELVGTQPPRLWVVTCGAQPVSNAGGPIACGAGALWGLGRVIEAEHPELWGGLVDLGGDRADVRALLRELCGDGGETQVTLRGGQRFVPRLVAASVPAAAPFRCRPEGTYLITGGLGGIGLQVAHWLIQHGARRLVLLGRTALPERTAWNDAHPAPVRARIAAVRALEAAGAAVTVLAADVGHAPDMRAAFETMRRTLAPLRGIVHAAGTIAPRLIGELDRETIAGVLRPKVAGTLILDELIADLELDFFVLCSSFESVIGMRGQGPYAAASAFLDQYAHDRARAGLPAVAINWGMWGQVGLAAAEPEKRFLVGEGLVAMAPEQALEHLGAVIEARVRQRIVMAADWRTFRAAFTSIPRRGRFLERIAAAAPPATRPPSPAVVSDAPPAADGDTLARELLAMVARVLRCAADKLDVDRPLNTIGLDSILAAELRNRIEFQLGVRVPMLALLRGTTAGIAAQVREQRDSAAPEAAAAAPPAPAPSPTPEVRAAAAAVVVTLPQPDRRAPGAGEVEIEIHAAGLTCGALVAATAVDCSGVITSVGDGVSHLGVGDAVVACALGPIGAHVTAPASFVAVRSASLGQVAAAALPSAVMTAHHALRDLARLRRGERLLVHSAAGATGLAAIQLALRDGAEVFATASTPEKVAYLEGLGVAHAMDSRSPSFADEVLRRTGGEGVDVVLNAFDATVAERSLAILRPYGRFIETGKRDAREEVVVTLAPFKKSLSYFAFDLASMAAHRPDRFASLLRQALELLEQGAVTLPPIHVYPMAEAGEAQTTLARAQHIGKLVLRAHEPPTSGGPVA